MPKITTKSYQEHFEQRGTAYEQAMRSFPTARDEEFMQVIRASRIVSSPSPQQLTVADVPSGGGYLRPYLPAHCRWLGHEPCASFHHQTASNQRSNQPLLPLPWQTSTIDAVISLAGLHHVEDKTALFREFHRVLKANGELVISDVATDSKVASFLDDYVGAHNSTGHDGIYLDDSTLTELEAANFTVTSHEQKDFLWKFNSEQEMADFCHRLFDLQSSSRTATLEAIECYLGTVSIAPQQIGMNWSLTTIRAVPKARNHEG